MTSDQVFQLIVIVFGAGGVGSALTYVFIDWFKARQQKAQRDRQLNAESAMLTVLSRALNAEETANEILGRALNAEDELYEQVLVPLIRKLRRL